MRAVRGDRGRLRRGRLPLRRVVFADQVDRLFRQHHRRRVGVARDERRHRRAIDDAQPADAVHAQPRVDHRQRVACPCAPCRSDGRSSRRCCGRTRAASSSPCACGAGLELALHVGLHRRRRSDRPRGATRRRASSADRAASTGSAAASPAARAGRRADPHVAARFGPQLADREREAGERMHLAAGHVGRERRDVELDVGRRRQRRSVGALQRAHEAAALVDADRERAAAANQPLQADRRLARERIELVVGRDRLRAFVVEADLQMVLQVLADAFERLARPARRTRASSAAGPMPESWSSCGVWIAPAASRTSARQRAVFSTPPCRYATPTARAPSNSTRGRVRGGLDPQVAAMARRLQERLRRAAAPAAVGRQLVVAGALLRGAVEVVVARHAELLRRRR